MMRKQDLKTNSVIGSQGCMEGWFIQAPNFLHPWQGQNLFDTVGVRILLSANQTSELFSKLHLVLTILEESEAWRKTPIMRLLLRNGSSLTSVSLKTTVLLIKWVMDRY